MHPTAQLFAPFGFASLYIMVLALLSVQIIPLREIMTKQMLTPTTGSPQFWFVLTTATSEKLFIGFLGTLVRYGPQEIPNAFGFAVVRSVQSEPFSAGGKSPCWRRYNSIDARVCRS